MAKTSTSAISVEKLVGRDNYNSWIFAMKAVLVQDVKYTQEEKTNDALFLAYYTGQQ